MAVRECPLFASFRQDFIALCSSKCSQPPRVPTVGSICRTESWRCPTPDSVLLSSGIAQRNCGRPVRLRFRR